MEVKDLIKQLKKLPQNMEVGITHHDNYEGEIAMWVESAGVVDEIDPETGEPTGQEVVALTS